MMAVGAFNQVHSVAALVRRSYRRHRRLARDAAAGRGLPRGACSRPMNSTMSRSALRFAEGRGRQA